VKRLIMELEREHPNIKGSMIKALSNVMPRHLLDRRLSPTSELRERVAAQLEDFADVPADVPITPLLMRSAGEVKSRARGEGTERPDGEA
jgi:hypothetical protein